MGDKIENSDSKFGFKDKEKAEETIKLLQSEELQYQKLTVRGLLGRAKRVLQMTKAAEKVKNINEAIEIFESWLENNGGSASNKNSKTDSVDKVETVPGLGFKDKEAAEKTLKILEGRDPEYQRLAVKGLIGSSKRVLTATKNEEKIQSIKQGVKILEGFLEKFERENLMKHNKAYLQSSIIDFFSDPDDELRAEFLRTYRGEKVKGNYKHLRTMYPKDYPNLSWDIVRNNNLKLLEEEMLQSDKKLFGEHGEPTDFHVCMIQWAYSPHIDKVKKYIELQKVTAQKRKLDDPGESESSPKKQKAKA